MKENKFKTSKAKGKNLYSDNSLECRKEGNMKKRGNKKGKVKPFTSTQEKKLIKLLKKGDSVKFIRTLQIELSKNGFYNRFLK